MREKKNLICFLLVFFLTIGLWTPGGADAAENTPEEILASMTTEEKISQMIVVSPRWYKPDGGERVDVTVLPEEIANYLSAHSFGGVILFDQNAKETEQTVRLIDSMQVANAKGGAKAQLFVSLDQEGGSVTRLNECVQGPGNMALAATGDDQDIETMMSIIGTEVAALGYNVDFCPDADVNNNAANPIIGIRSFSDDPGIVCKDVRISLEALEEAGVIGCPKHFPGHGDTNVDSHSGLPMIDKSYEEIKELELLPFTAAIDQGMDMVMTAHIVYPQIETGTYTSKSTGEEISLPATLSKTIITDILRGDMGYEGVVITDALDMKAITSHFDPIEAAGLAIRAGVDMLLVPCDITTSTGRTMLNYGIRALVSMANNDAAFMANVDASVLRILKLKEKYGLLSAYDETKVESKVEYAKSVVSTKANHDVEWDITKRAMTLVKNSDNTLPLRDEGEKTVILTVYDDEPVPMEYIVSLLGDEGKLPEGATYEVHSCQGMTEHEKWEEVLGWIDGADNVIAVSEMQNAAYLTGNYANLLDKVIAKTHDQKGKFILMSVFLPYDVARFQEADAIMITYGARSMNLDPRTDKEPMKRYGPNIAAALYLMLEGEETPTGKLPVNLPKLNETGDEYLKEILYARDFGLSYEKHANEWVNGRWYDKDGAQTWEYRGSWKKGGEGWRFEDTSGWYAKNRWQKIDGKWYYFDKDGIMEADAYRGGYYLKKDGSWNGKAAATGWKNGNKGWLYFTSPKTVITNGWKKIDGKWYFFKETKTAAESEFVKGYWFDKNCVQSDPARYSWHKTARGWWYGVSGGWYAKNTSYTIDGVKYTFDKNGYMK